MKRRVLEVIHWVVVIFLVISVVIFIFETSSLLNPDDVVIKDNKLYFCESNHCVNLGEKIFWTFLEILLVEVVVGGLALVAIREEISIEKRSEEHKL